MSTSVDLVKEVRILEKAIGGDNEKKILEMEIAVAKKLRAHIKNN